MARSGRRTLLGACSALALLSCSEPAAAPVFRFSAIPDQDETRLIEKFRPVADYLARSLGVACEYVPLTEYQDAVDLFRNGDIQMAWFGGLTGAQARAQVPGARAIAQGEEDLTYYSYFIAHQAAGVGPAQGFPFDLEGKRFTFGSSSSTSGRLMPEFYIREATGRSPAEFFGVENHYSGSHDKTIELVESGQFQAGAVNYLTYERRVQEGQTDPDVCRVIWKAGPYVDYNFTAHPVLERMFGAGFIDRLQRALLEMKDDKLLMAFPRRSLVPASNADYARLEALARELGFLR